MKNKFEVGDKVKVVRFEDDVPQNIKDRYLNHTGKVEFVHTPDGADMIRYRVRVTGAGIPFYDDELVLVKK